MTLSIVIPTLDRGEVLLATIESLERLEPRPLEILVVDQTAQHDPATESELAALHRRGAIRWLRQEARSIPMAMNRGLLEARGEIVLFVDDDVEPTPKLANAHAAAHAARKGEIIAGQVLQPGERPEPLVGREYSFRSSVAQEVGEVIGCNFSVSRAMALHVGGFDELFVRAAYRFEADFCDRARAAGATIYHEPAASLRHLKAPRGGTRAYGNYLTTFSPSHAVGEYYYLLRRRPAGWIGRFLLRPLRAVRTRHHLRRPWWIPATLCAETLAMGWAICLIPQRPRLVEADAATGASERCS